MKFHFLWFIPIPVFYVSFKPLGFDGYTFGLVILIHKASKDDDGLHRHELEHVRQGIVTLGLHIPLYLFYRPYRIWAERKANEAQTAVETDGNSNI